MDLGSTLARLGRALGEDGIDFALIGGLALGFRGVPRMTGDIDLLVQGEAAGRCEQAVLDLGFSLRFASEEVMQFHPPGEDASGGIDILLARRAHTLGMLARAKSEEVMPGTRIKVLDAEDLIGLKVQASSNDPARHALDMGDIERMLAQSPDLDLERIREYFLLFEREQELDELLERQAKC